MDSFCFVCFQKEELQPLHLHRSVLRGRGVGLGWEWWLMETLPLSPKFALEQMQRLLDGGDCALALRCAVCCAMCRAICYAMMCHAVPCAVLCHVPCRAEWEQGCGLGSSSRHIPTGCSSSGGAGCRCAWQPGELRGQWGLGTAVPPLDPSLCNRKALSVSTPAWPSPALGQPQHLVLFLLHRLT